MPAVDLSRAPRRTDRPPVNARPETPPPRIAEDAFIAETVVDAWIRNGAAARVGPILTLADGPRYVLRDAVRVIGRRNGDTDPYGFTGRIDALRDLIRRGATLSVDALRLGPVVYDIEYGYVAAPIA